MNSIRSISTDGRRIYQLATSTCGGDCHLIAGGYDGRITAYAIDGRIVWDTKTGGFPFCIFSYDINNDGFDEILVASADYNMYVIDHKGNILWTFKTNGPVYQTAAGKLDGINTVIAAGGVDRHIYILSPKGKLVQKKKSGICCFPTAQDSCVQTQAEGAITMLRFGRLAGGEKDFLLADSSSRKPHTDIFCYEGSDLRQVWNKRIVPFSEEPHFSSLSVKNSRWSSHKMICSDINDDGKDEILIGSTGLTGITMDDIVVLDGSGEFLYAKRNQEKENRNDQLYRFVTSVVGETGAAREKKIFSISGPRLMIFDAIMERVFDAKAQISFTALEYIHYKNKKYLFLAVNGDDRIVVIDLDQEWEKQFASLKRTGIGEEIRCSIEQIKKTIENAPPHPEAKFRPDKKYTVEIAAVFMIRQKLSHLDHYIDHYRWVREQFPYENLQLATVFWLSELGCKKSEAGRDWTLDHRMDYDFTQAEILHIAARLEKEKVPFMIQNSHGCGGFLKLDTIKKICQTAPEYFIGLIGSETNHFSELPAFVSEYIKPEMELLKKHGGKKLILREGSQFWPIVLSDKEIFKIIFDPQYADTIIPTTEEAVSRNGELHVAARTGMWMSGLVDTWGTRVIADQLRVNPHHCWDTVLSGHPYLRLLIAHTALGASFFMFHHGMDNGSGEPGFTPMGEDFFWTNVGNESSVLFMHLLGKKIIIPPEKEMMNLSKTALVLHPLTNRLKRDISIGHEFDAFIEERGRTRYVISQFESWWALANTFDTDISALLWGKKKQYGRLIPNTRYGMVPILSSHAKVPDNLFTELVHTDGDNYLVDGENVSPENGKNNVIKISESGSMNLPFQCMDDIFLHAESFMHLKGYRIYLVDIHLVVPQDRLVAINTKIDTKIIKDALTGVEIPIANGSFTIEVKAGTFRILDVLL